MDILHPVTIISTAVCYSQCQNSYVFIRAVIKKWGPGARFSKVPIINGPGKLSPFTLKIEVSIVLHLA